MGQVEHSERLDPVSQNALPGKVFSDALTQSLVKKSSPSKSLVPSWLAGSWERNQSTETARISLPSNMRQKPAGVSVAKVTDKFGSFKDAQGRIWQLYDPGKAEGQVDRGDLVDHHVVSFYELIVTGPKSAVVEVTATHLVVNKETSKITSVYQDEEINTYTSVVDGQVRTDASIKVFDEHGKAIFLTKSVSMEARVAPFQDPVK